MIKRGWDSADFLLVSGDAYVDHPSFGHAIISRVLEAEGFRVAILAQPDWTDAKSFLACGIPRLGVLVASGVVDSMVNHYTAAKKRRSGDAYSPGGRAGLRPDRALITYCNRLKSVIRDKPVIIGGVEAGLRIFSHYDYWDDSIRKSVLADSGADLLVYGMGEAAIIQIARRLAGGEPVAAIRDVRGTAYMETGEAFDASREKGGLCAIRPDGGRLRHIELPTHADARRAKKTYAESVALEHAEQDPMRGNVLYQRNGAAVIVKNPPALPLPQAELDRVYGLPYERAWHPCYDGDGGVPALEEVKYSVVSHRGCFGGCSFCSINLHQGRIVQKRSVGSIVAEVESLARDKDFKGYIHDIGGPSANLRDPACAEQLKRGACRSRRCLFPTPCKHLSADHSEYMALLEQARGVEGVKKVFIRSGVRYDYIMLDKKSGFLRELCEHHVSGQLKVAPEHISRTVLAHMGKPPARVFEAFGAEYLKTNIALGKKQYMVPYLISGHPGSMLTDAVDLAAYLNEKNINPEQVQDFYPTPGTLSTCMYYTGIDPLSMKRVHVPSGEEKIMQRALLQCRKPENRSFVIKALRLAGRADLIGFGKGCLIRPGRGDAPPRQQTAAGKPGAAGARRKAGAAIAKSKISKASTSGDAHKNAKRTKRKKN